MDNKSSNATSAQAGKGLFAHMTNMFPVSKTLAFRLVPVGRTQDHIKAAQAIESAGVLAKDYENLKAAADRVHKDFIEETLSKLHLKYLSDGSSDSIQEYAEAFFDETMDQDQKEGLLEKIAAGLKAQITEAFAKVPFSEKQGMLGALASKSLLTEILPTRTLSEEEKKSLARLSLYTTYMRPYFTCRNRIYDCAEKGHTIPVRTVNDNLPIHLANTRVFAALPAEVINDAAPVFEFVSSGLQAYALDDVFTPSFFATLCAQSAIDTYNTLIGGVSNEDGSRVQGLNELVNLYNQAHKDAKVKPFKKLRKQILTDRDTLSWLPETIANDDAAVKVAERLLDAVTRGFTAPASTAWDPTKVYVSADRLNTYSHKIFGDWGLAARCLRSRIQDRTPRKTREGDKGYAERLDKIYKGMKSFSLSVIHDTVKAYASGDGLQDAILDAGTALRLYFMNEILANYSGALADGQKFMTHVKDGRPDSKLGQDPKDGTLGAGAILKDMLEKLTDAKNAAAVFTDLMGTLDTDPEFYPAVVDPFREIAGTLVPAHNSIRNYLTKKPYSDDKVQLYFDTPNLLGGWDLNKEGENRSVILREGDALFLGIMPKHAKKLFSGALHADPSSPLAKMEIKFIPNPHMTLPHVAFSGKAVESGTIPAAVLALYKSGKKVKDYTPAETAMMIDFYKGVIASKPDWSVFGFRFAGSTEYARLADFFTDVAAQGFRAVFNGVSRDYVESAVENGDLYLFRISCQDMLEKHNGKDGDYKALLYEALSGKPGSKVRLCGGGAIYYRKSSLERTITHPAGVPMQNKNPDSKRLTRTLHYDLIKDRRFTEDRYMFHIPVKIFPDADARGAMQVNRKVQQIIRENPGMYVLGINRGERNLISVAVTAPDGTIVEQRNYNVFDNFDYRRKLDEREKERTEDRKNWTSVKEIKNLKAGYLSRAVGEVASLVKKYGCLVAMENLDNAFKNGRQRFEKNVYEQFERDLVSKLAFLSDKDAATDRVDTVLQLANPGKTETERTRFPQNGILFLMNPSWISKTDPLTGFVNRLNTHYNSVKESEELLSRLDGFRYNPGSRRFEISFHYDKAAPGKEAGDGSRVWTVETFGERIEQIFDTTENPKGVWKENTVLPTEEMKTLLDNHGIDYKDGRNLIRTIIGAAAKSGRAAEFYKELLRLLRLTLQNTNWDSGTKEFRVIGCTADGRGQFYDSRIAPAHMPKDGDVLAAWNIARKAHMVLRNIRTFEPGVTLDEKGKKAKGPRTVIGDAEWFAETMK